MSNNLVAEINTKLDEVQALINSNEPANLRAKMDDIKNLIQDYETSSPTEENIVNDINYALRNQNLSIEEREQLLNTKIRQVQLATERNGQTKNMLTMFIIINVVILISFVSLIVMKATGSK
jgi:t-SNARE complex subunit (syntaxin)